MRGDDEGRRRVDLRRSLESEESEDPDLRVLAAAAVSAAGRVLLMREEDEPFRKAWVLPEGYPRPGEPLRVAAVREVAEELGLDVEVEGLLGVYEEFSATASEAKVHWIIVAYRARPTQNPLPRPSREAIDFAWIDPSARWPIVPPVVRRMLDDLAQLRVGWGK
jgi:ADP-ribose pyrophosphatase YjhB (NUDIX family)